MKAQLLTITDTYGESEATSKVVVIGDVPMNPITIDAIVREIYDDDDLVTTEVGRYYSIDSGCHGVTVDEHREIPMSDAEVLKNYLLTVEL